MTANDGTVQPYDEVTITVNANVAPVANAGDDRSWSVNDGSGATDSITLTVYPLAKSVVVKKIWRSILNPMVKRLNEKGFSNNPYTD